MIEVTTKENASRNTEERKKCKQILRDKKRRPVEKTIANIENT